MANIAAGSGPDGGPDDGPGPWPVVIAGGGPVGVTLAMELARLGVRSLVLERRHDQPPNPRCNTTNARSMELLRRLGCADAVRRAGLPPEHSTDIVYLTRLTGPELVRYRRSTTGEILAGQPRRAAGWREDDSLVAANWPTPEPQHYLSQLFLEPVLRRHAVDHWGVELRTGWDYEAFTDHVPTDPPFPASGADDPAGAVGGPSDPAAAGRAADDLVAADEGGVTVVARNLADGRRHELRARFLVGTDGSGSVVRTAIGARLTGVPRLGDTVSTFFRSPELRSLARGVPGWMFRFIGSATLIAIDGRDQWLIHTPVPPGQSRETYDPEPAIFQAVGQPFAYEVLGRARWTPRAMVATKFREGRIFLAGDAAHLWIPMGGFGMNAGIVDAVSLAWRLAGVLGGSLHPRILDTYETERAPLGERVAAQAAKWGADLRPLARHTPERLAELEASPEARAELGAAIRATNLGEFECPGFQLGYVYLDSPVICHDPHEPPPATTLERYVESTWPGARLPHIWRATGQSIFDQLGPAFTLIRTTGAPPGGALIEGAAARGVDLTALDVGEADGLARYGAGALVLVRPDQHVVWRSTTGPGGTAVDPDRAEADRVWDTVTGRALPARTVTRLEAALLGGGFRFGEGLRYLAAGATGPADASAATADTAGAAADAPAGPPDVGRLVFSDMTGCRVVAADPATGALTTLHEVPGQPNGLGRLSDGRLVVASMFDRRLLITATDDPASPLREWCDLSAVATGYLGDLCVDAADRVYVGDTGARVLHGEPIAPSGRLIRVTGAGRADEPAAPGPEVGPGPGPVPQVEVLADGLNFPNGMGFSPDGQMLFLGLSGDRCVVQHRLWADGALGPARPFARQTPDGLAVEPAGGPRAGVWVCHPGKALVVRYDQAGRPTAEVHLPVDTGDRSGGPAEGRAIACAVDPEATTLWVVGIQALDPGINLFEAMAAGATTGLLWRADISRLTGTVNQ